MLLYHYTNAAGLLGIINGRELWATDSRFLNDTLEFQIGRMIFNQLYKSNYHAFEPHHIISREVLDAELELNNLSYNIFVSSLSQKGDLLSQWKGYNRGLGFSIGFSAQSLNQNAIAQRFSLTPVGYTENHKFDAFGMMRDAFSVLLSEIDKQNDDFNIMGGWWPHVLKVMATVKDGAFYEEDEYRIVQVAHEGILRNLSVRSSGSKIVPYIPVKLDKYPEHAAPFKNLGIEEIIVGPGLPDIQVEAVKLFLLTKDMNIPVRKSGIPYVAD